MEKLHHFLKFMRTDANAELVSISLRKNQTVIFMKMHKITNKKGLSTQHRKTEVSEMVESKGD